MEAMYYLLVALGAYLLGSIPFAYIVVKKFAHKDVMQYGTGNVGTMNTHRATNSKLLALLVLIGDVGKGMAAYFLARYVFDMAGDNAVSMQSGLLELIALAGLMVVVGHNHSLFLKFKGGKGLATAAGFLLLLNPLIVLIWLGIWILVLIPWRIFVLGQILATVALPPVVWFWQPENFWIVLLICIPVFIKHSPRIKTVLDGTEPRMYYKVRDGDSKNG